MSRWDRDTGIMTEWQADALIPREIWYAGWGDMPHARTLQIGGRRVEAPNTAGGFARLMAAVMVDRSAADGACTEQHLAAAGFTAGEIALHADRARELARDRIAAREGQSNGRHRVTCLKPIKPVVRVRAGSAAP